uniref:AGC-kinase C-terminal domain-containing protein n=1 Tax=Steinernema glaseri TaxID=37863 RepID=A0A1I7ZCW7_9BILA
MKRVRVTGCVTLSPSSHARNSPQIATHVKDLDWATFFLNIHWCLTLEKHKDVPRSCLWMLETRLSQERIGKGPSGTHLATTPHVPPEQEEVDRSSCDRREEVSVYDLADKNALFEDLSPPPANI